MTPGDWIQSGITVVLVLITAWYAWETRRIVRNMENDREAMHRPVLAFQLVAWQAGFLKLKIQNVGNGVAVKIEGKIESDIKTGSASFPWSYTLLCANQYEEFGFPMPEGSSTNDRFKLDTIKEKVIQVKAEFAYESVTGKKYVLEDSLPIQKITQDWVASRMLITQDHPDRIMPRIAETLENIKKEMEKFHN
jgi:hypothetical protein